ncbi:MAG: hypothetical protein ACHQQS_04920 [Thermoanaerobaculales bacterium]
MLRKALTLAASILCVLVLSCSKETKPEKKGGWVVQPGKLVELPGIIVDQEFTPEGFAINTFTGDPTVTVVNGRFYFILYGNYKPYDLKVYIHRGGRYIEDTSKGAITQGLEVGLIKGETEMYKCRMTKPLPAGIYALEALKGTNTVSFPFNLYTE